MYGRRHAPHSERCVKQLLMYLPAYVAPHMQRSDTTAVSSSTANLLSASSDSKPQCQPITLAAHTSWTLRLASMLQTPELLVDCSPPSDAAGTCVEKRRCKELGTSINLTMQSICSMPLRRSSAHVKCPAMTLRGFAGMVAVLQSSPSWQGM